MKWTETYFSSCYFSYILFPARLRNEISASLSIYNVLCWSSDAPPITYRSLNYWLLPLYKCLYHRLPDVIMSVWFLSSTHILLKCKLVALSELIHLNSGMPEVLQDLHECLRTWSVRLHCRFMWNASVCVLLYSGLRRAMFRCIEMRVCLKLNQRVLSETSCPQ